MSRSYARVSRICWCIDSSKKSDNLCSSAKIMRLGVVESRLLTLITTKINTSIIRSGASWFCKSTSTSTMPCRRRLHHNSRKSMNLPSNSFNVWIRRKIYSLECAFGASSFCCVASDYLTGGFAKITKSRNCPKKSFCSRNKKVTCVVRDRRRKYLTKRA